MRFLQILGEDRGERETARMRADVVGRFHIDSFTCDDCPTKRRCEFAFDPYNTDGDCLAEK